MGLQVRRRTKGKTSWQNFSYSKKGGARTSTSIKSGQVTYNTGNLLGKRKSRVTVNLGGGARYVWNSKSKDASSRSADEGESLGYVWAIAIMGTIIGVVALVINYFWWVVAVLAVVFVALMIIAPDKDNGVQ